MPRFAVTSHDRQRASHEPNVPDLAVVHIDRHPSAGGGRRLRAFLAALDDEAESPRNRLAAAAVSPPERRPTSR